MGSGISIFADFPAADFFLDFLAGAKPGANIAASTSGAAAVADEELFFFFDLEEPRVEIDGVGSSGWLSSTTFPYKSVCTGCRQCGQPTACPKNSELTWNLPAHSGHAITFWAGFGGFGWGGSGGPEMTSGAVGDETGAFFSWDG